MERIEELYNKFKDVDVINHAALLQWLKDMFEACEHAGAEVPHRIAIASRIGRAHRLLPDPQLPDFPPEDEQGYTRWILVTCIVTLTTAGSPSDLAALYGMTAYAIGTWLLRFRSR